LLHPEGEPPIEVGQTFPYRNPNPQLDEVEECMIESGYLKKSPTTTAPTATALEDR
jgi:hypothetical protein